MEKKELLKEAAVWSPATPSKSPPARPGPVSGQHNELKSNLGVDFIKGFSNWGSMELLNHPNKKKKNKKKKKKKKKTRNEIDFELWKSEIKINSETALTGAGESADSNSVVTSSDRIRGFYNWVSDLGSKKETSSNGFDSKLGLDLNLGIVCGLGFGEYAKGFGFTGIASASSEGVLGGFFGGFCDSSHATVDSNIGFRNNFSSGTAISESANNGITGHSFPVSHYQFDNNFLKPQNLVFGKYGNNANSPSTQMPHYGNPNDEKEKNEVLSEGNNFLDDENSQPQVGLASNATPSPSEKTRKRRIDLNKKPQERPKKKRYWPKIASEIFKKTPTKMPKLSTPAPRTPKKSPHEKRKYVRKKNIRTCPQENFDPSVMVQENEVKSKSSENVDGEAEDMNSEGPTKSCKRALNFQLEKTDACTQIVGTDLKSPPGIKVSRFNPLYVYQRTFRKNDCPGTSRKLGPNFPRMWKKRRVMRRKLALYDVLCNFMASQDGQRWVSKKVRGKRTKRKSAKVGVIPHELKKGVIKADTCSRKSFGGKILPTKAQSEAPIGDQECLKCVLSLCPTVNRKRERSKGLKIRRILPQFPLLTSSIVVQRQMEGKDKDGHEASLVPRNDCKATKGRNNMVFGRTSAVSYRNKFEGSDRNGYKASIVLPFSYNEVTKLQNNMVIAPTNALSYWKEFEGIDKIGHKASIVLPFSDSVMTKVNNSMVLVPTRTVSDRTKFERYPTKNRDRLTMPKSPRETVLQLFDIVVKGLENLHIDDKGGKLVMPYQKENHGTLVVFKKPKPPPRPHIDFDSETIRVWNRIMGSDGTDDVEEEDEEREKLWEEQRKVFRGRVDSFIARMHLIQGDRRFLRWKGSVIDSVVGVFLTQNVADVLSSSAYMSLAAKFPFQPTNNHRESDEVEDIPLSQASVGSNDTEDIGGACDANGEQVLSQETEKEITHQLEENSKETVVINTCFSSMDMGSTDLNDKKMNDFGAESKSAGRVEFVASQTEVNQEATPKSQEAIIMDPDVSSTKCQVPLKSKSSQGEKAENVSRTEKSSGTKGNKAEKKHRENIDWDNLRKTYSKGGVRESDSDTMDSLDWEAVRKAEPDKVANCIKGRGQYNILGQKIQEFLDRVVRDHGSLDLEWLRDVPPEKTKEYLLSINGLGLKSVECVRLLCLHHHAFPVDTNVNRIAVRLGWVPLRPLPGNIHFHLLDTYPIMDAVQKYLWPRLCTLDQRTLYELHYQMITFGKVFCTKGKPNCGPCPMRGECRHYASAVASARLSLPGPPERSMVRSNVPIPSFHNLEEHITQTALSLLKANLSDKYQSKSCEPIIEYPASPEPECSEPQVRDIEDYCSEPENEIITIRLDAEELKENLLDYLSKANMPSPEDNMSKALVVMTSEAASKPAPKLKSVSRLRTVHHVYELPDTHPLVATLDKREPDDPCPYLLAIWTQAEATNSGEPQCNSQEPDLRNECNNFQQGDPQTVRGTLLIPCRTAMRGRFPLNGTYFQVNEVFADDESTTNPINVPRAWIWHLHRRDLYCATQVTSIFKGLSTDEVQYCFWRGFVCVRSFDRKTRAPRKLDGKFHVTLSATAKRKEKV